MSSIFSKIGHDIHHAFEGVKHGVEDVGKDVGKLGKDAGHIIKDSAENAGHLFKAGGDVLTGNFSGAKEQAKALGHGIIGEGKDVFHEVGDGVKTVEGVAKVGLEASPVGLVLDNTGVGQKIMKAEAKVGGVVFKGISAGVRYSPLGMLDKAAEEGKFGGALEKAATAGTGVVNSVITKPLKTGLTSTNFADKTLGEANLASNFIPGVGLAADAGRAAEGTVAAAKETKAIEGVSDASKSSTLAVSGDAGKAAETTAAKAAEDAQISTMDQARAKAGALTDAAAVKARGAVAASAPSLGGNVATSGYTVPGTVGTAGTAGAGAGGEMATAATGAGDTALASEATAAKETGAGTDALASGKLAYPDQPLEAYAQFSTPKFQAATGAAPAA